MKFLAHLESFFSEQARLKPGNRLLVAFSGGLDSTALLWGLREIAAKMRIGLHAVHVDHRFDGDSQRRANEACHLATKLGVEITAIRCRGSSESSPGESQEAAARRIRYDILEAQRQRLQATFTATAHHADDQIETLLIRLLYGTGIEGLAGIRAVKGKLVRPLLSWRRSELAQIVAQADLKPVTDPTNYRLDVPRNRLRHLVWPRLLDAEPALPARLLNLAATAHRTRQALAEKVGRALEIQSTSNGLVIRQQDLMSLPRELWPHALSLLHREAGVPYPPGTTAQRDLLRQINEGGRVGCDCGAGWRWESSGDLLRLCRQAPRPLAFAYTLEVPGECEIPELALRLRLRRGSVASWMFRHSSRRVGLCLPIEPGDHVIVRSRRTGDRVRPLGCAYSRRLKEVLIDRRIPRWDRGQIPLLEVNSQLAWVPGVTIDDTFRVGEETQAWIAELEPI